MKRNKLIVFLAFTTLVNFIPNNSQATSLSLGADYHLKGISITQRDKTLNDLDYYDQRLQGYLITDLSQEVEATIKIQSITPWGYETSTTTLQSRYPNANGQLWVQNAFLRLPKLWKDNIVLTVGRQPLQWGDGSILSDDELGFNAIRAQMKSPWEKLSFDIEGFLAKINESLASKGDKDLYGASIGFDRQALRWEIMGLLEKSDGNQNYENGADTTTFTASKIDRQILGVRVKSNLRDAYVKGEYYLQTGKVKQASGARDVDLSGTGYLFGLGGKSNTSKYGRFGAVVEYAVGDGDKADTPNKDESFRPSFAGRWNGLERKGYGKYYAATFSDAYSPTDPFGEASSQNDGLPAGTSGIQTIKFGVDSTPLPKWTFSFDYFQFKAQKNISGPKELGTEFDYGVVYRYSGLVSAHVSYSQFRPGDAYPQSSRQTANFSSVEVLIKF
ncbi:MAG: alginate export family protein [Elusimicrobiota bacterium]